MSKSPNLEAALRAPHQLTPIALLACIGMLCAAMPLTAGVPSTPMEAAIDQLRARFPNQIVVGFEELWDPRPDTEPHIDLGPPNASLQDVLARMRRDNPQYKVDLLPGNLVHVYPAHGSADPPGLLDLRLTEFFLPPDDCVAQQFAYMDSPMGFFSYTPELSKYLWEHKRAWYHAQGKEPGGFAGDLLGDCLPSTHRRDPIYHNITVREALNLMAIRSLQVASGQALGAAHSYPKARPISWKFRFRREPDADSGLGGVPIFQIF